MRSARLQILAATVLFSTGGAAIKLCALNGWQIASGRAFITALFLALTAREARRLPDLRVLALCLAYSVMVIGFVLANKLTTATNANFLQQTAPLYVILLSPWLLQERVTR